jgi:photosystem II stability/assembly factor-like uncharacterized protein
MKPNADPGTLGPDLLDLTEPPGGLEDRVLAGFPAAGTRRMRPGRRRQWALGAVALLMAAVTVAALLVVRPPAAHVETGASVPRPAAVVQAPPPVSSHVIAAASFTGQGNGWIAQSAGVSATADGGRHWTAHPGPDLSSGVLGIWTGPGDEVLVVTRQRFVPGDPPAELSPVFWRSIDGGAHWRELRPPGGGPPQAFQAYPLWVKDAREAWLVTQSGGLDPVATVRHTTDGGQTWQQQATFDVRAALGRDESVVQGELVFLDSRRGVLQTGGSTGPDFPPEPPSVLATADGGAHWTKVHLPQAPPGIDSTNQAGALVVPTHGGDLALVLQGVGTGRDASGAAKLSPAYVYSSPDGGLHWVGPRALPGDGGPLGNVHLTALDDTHWWWAVGTDVYFSSDRGRHWSPAGALPNPAQISDLRFSTATDGWARAANMAGNGPNTLFLTSDGGRTWSAVEPPDPIRVRVGCDAVPAPAVTYHVHLSYLASGGLLLPPAGVGVTSGCRYWLSTRDAAGVITVDLPQAQKGVVLTLGDFLDVWATDIQPQPGQPVAVFVNGQRYQGDPRAIPLREHADIVIEIDDGNPTQPPPFHWPPGL